MFRRGERLSGESAGMRRKLRVAIWLNSEYFVKGWLNYFRCSANKFQELRMKKVQSGEKRNSIEKPTLFHSYRSLPQRRIRL